VGIHTAGELPQLVIDSREPYELKVDQKRASKPLFVSDPEKSAGY